MADPLEATAPQPRANPALVGHRLAEQTLLRAWQSNRLHHAWLITGPRGIGKATLAFRFARHVLAAEDRSLFAGASGTLDVPRTAPVFRQVASGGHPDLLTIERGYDEKRDRYRTEIVVDDVRELATFMHLKAAAGGWRVLVIDSIDDLNRNAANALLKVLEEPPAQALLILVSHAPGRLLPTIRSRCRRLTLGPLDEPVMEELLSRYSPELADADRRVLIRITDGSIGRALEIAAAGGLDLYRDIAGQLLQLPKLDAVALHGLGDRLGHRDAADLFRLATELLTAWIGRVIRVAATGQGSADIIEGEGLQIAALAARRSLDQWLELWEKLTSLFARAESANLDRKQVWVGAMLDIAGLASR
jgi:DNA polymerase-3 subunit delta'